MSHMKQICSDVDLKNSYRDTVKIDISCVKQRLFEGLSSNWLTSCTNMSKLDLYRQIKPTFGVERFLNKFQTW